MKAIGPMHQVILLCDSWYPKAEGVAFVERFENLEMVCNARVDMALYELPPAKTGEKGRPRKCGDRIQLEEFVLGEPESGDWLTGMMPVSTTSGKAKRCMPWLLHPKMEKETAVYSYAQLIREPFLLTERAGLTKQFVHMEEKIPFICRWPGMA